MLISEVLTAGLPLQVDLLTALPDSSDPSTWQRPNYSSGEAPAGIPIISSAPPLLLGTLNVDVLPRLVAPAVIVAYGLIWQGNCVLIGQCSPFYLADGFPCVFQASFCVYQWTT